MLGYEHVLLLMPALVLLAATGLPGKQPSQVGVTLVSAHGGFIQANKQKWMRISIYLWIAILPYIVVLAQASIQKEYPAIIQSMTMLALCWSAKLRWTDDERRRTNDEGRRTKYHYAQMSNL
jgi:hypothetical protein